MNQRPKKDSRRITELVVDDKSCKRSRGLLTTSPRRDQGDSGCVNNSDDQALDQQ